ncbi:hypothetical protein ACPOM7_14485 [Peribacillus castrilensis]|jgi:hypothetical protein|uniref:Uncharacterized protein n=3 Tax=Peribacillus TaxID=2675229 RepID=A0A9X9EUI2_9BACI|nr:MULTISPECIES: hypothetical protein [Bacillaceae]KOR77247.1 hypothetical protein AM232_01230 [Bacillus sp. FJAT-21352]KOR84654.1 hypothetical protein AM233_11500 [Bacillus sp. FJAT-22058]KRF49943.1 hypothetical protein ASG97_14780 [Bacillus sp. Soil745]MBD8138027.1 hypothetical protein [Bacillus sp. CFBP 13597]MBL3644285.1 hypothetical protein [Bacillus sp. RHFB]MBT2604896.1 hypothetical protein [Bacillus sp. ISL-53]MCD1162617.1 hypothetical protein [Peribacillus castrilensis]MDP9743144.1
MILLKVDDRKFGKSNIKYSVVDKETNELIISGVFKEFGQASDKYYELKDEYGPSNVKMILK